MKVDARARRRWLVYTLAAFTCVTLAGNRSAHVRVPKPLTKNELVELTRSPEVRSRPRDFINDVLKPNGIGFLPTNAVREELGEAGVPDEILDVLVKNSTRHILLKVCKFRCDGCPPDAGESFAVNLQDTIFDAKERFYSNIDDFLYGKRIDREVGPVGGYNVNSSQDIYIFVEGTLTKRGRQYNVYARLSYIDAGESGAKSIAHKEWSTPVTGASRQKTREIAQWYVDSLSSSLR